MSSGEVAARCYKALMRGEMTAVIGVKNKLLSLSTRLVPRKLVVLVAAKLMQ
jgi:short-subunit dehydrogenase